jgi:hypothetical protein
MWAEDNIKNYPYLLVNQLTDQNGQPVAIGAQSYTKAPEIPPAMAALLQITEQDMRDVLGNQQAGEQMQPNISGKAIELIQGKLDMQTFIYISNFGKSIKRSGEVWLSMAKDILVEEGRKMKGVTSADETTSIELLKPRIESTGEVGYENDLSEADFDVGVDIGPSSASKKQSTVRSLTGMMAITQDPETLQVLGAMAMMNMEGEGIGEVRDYFRKKLIKMGVVKPSDEEMEELQQEMQNQAPDPNAEFLKASAEQAQAEAAKARADTVLTVAKAEETKAKTLETLAKIDATGGQQTGPAPDVGKAALEVEAMQLENQIKKLKMIELAASIEGKHQQGPAAESSIPANQQLQATVAEIGASVSQAVDGLNQTASVIGSAAERMSEAIGQFAETSNNNMEKALDAIAKPKRVIRENGRVIGIE